MNPCSNPPPSALYAHGSAEAANPNPSSLQPPPKKKRSLPGTPDPEAEVVALSPRSLMATNRFVCEVCGKGFQRDQNLQLHRRGHNLPWRLRQRKEAPRKKVYVCPVEACVHHEPARALGDLTGIKKHYSRKHGEKKWKCHKCSKRYAVQSDWKAHSKNCGTREYACDCGTVFSRKDSFVTHRAFCDALVQETAKLSADAAAEANHHLSFSQPQPPLGNADAFNRQYSTQPPILDVEHKARHSLLDEHQHLGMMPPLPNSGLMIPQVLSMDEASMYLSDHIITEAAAGSPCGLSATALLQKAAQMGSATSPASSTLFAGLGGTFPALQRPPMLLAPFPSMGEQQGPLGQSATADGVDGNNSWSTGGSGSAAEGELGSGFTRDFLGVGGAEEDCLKRSFVPELAGFDGMCSAIDAFRSSLGYR